MTTTITQPDKLFSMYVSFRTRVTKNYGRMVFCLPYVKLALRQYPVTAGKNTLSPMNIASFGSGESTKTFVDVKIKILGVTKRSGPLGNLSRYFAHHSEEG